jgi:hypothetical protein
MKKRAVKKLNPQEKAVLMEIIAEQPQLVTKVHNIGWSDTPLFKSAAEERQMKLF